jgi:protein KRI1
MQKTEPQNDVDVLKRFWGGESDVLDEKDRFLRKFILTKGWVDRDEVYDKRDDSEEYEEKVDRYEEKYNFRYEEPGGTTLTTYQRNIEGTVREGGNEARRTKRHAKESRIQ